MKKIVILSYPLAFDAPVRGVPVGISPPRLVWKNYRMVGLPDGEKNEDIYNGLDTIPACDGQTGGRTDILPRHIRAMHTRRAVKMCGSVRVYRTKKARNGHFETMT